MSSCDARETLHASSSAIPDRKLAEGAIPVESEGVATLMTSASRSMVGEASGESGGTVK